MSEKFAAEQLMKRAYEVVHHETDCPSVGGGGDKDCRCDAVPFLRDLSATLQAKPDWPSDADVECALNARHLGLRVRDFRWESDNENDLMRAALQSVRPPAKTEECANGCPERQVCDYCQGTPGNTKDDAGVSSLVNLWRQKEVSDEPETEFDKGCEQTYNECADALESFAARHARQGETVDGGAPCRACGSVSVDTGFECNDCGYDNSRWYDAPPAQPEQTRQVPDGCIPIHRTLLGKLAIDMDAIDMPKIGAAIRRWVARYDAAPTAPEKD